MFLRSFSILSTLLFLLYPIFLQAQVIKSGDKYLNTNLELRDGSEDNTDLWEFQDSDESPYYKIKLKQSNKCLDVPASSTAYGEGLILYECLNNDNQKWKLVSKGGAFYIQSKSSGMYASVASTDSNEYLVQEKFSTSSPQLWQISGLILREGESSSYQLYAKYIDELLKDSSYAREGSGYIGSGCQGTVFKIKHLQENREYVVKVPNAGSQAEIDSRKEIFESELVDTKKLLEINRLTQLFLSTESSGGEAVAEEGDIYAQMIGIPKTDWIERGDKFGLIKEYLPGKPLVYFLTEDTINDNPSHDQEKVFFKFNELILNLAFAGIYLEDLNQSNFIFNENEERWYIIDFMNLRHVSDVDDAIFKYFTKGLPIFMWEDHFYGNIQFRFRVHDALAKILQDRKYQPYFDAQKLPLSADSIRKGLDPNFRDENGIPRIFKENSDANLAILIKNGANIHATILDGDKQIDAISYREKNNIGSSRDMTSLFQTFATAADTRVRFTDRSHKGFRLVLNDPWMPTIGINHEPAKDFSIFKPDDYKCDQVCIAWSQVSPGLDNVMAWDMIDLHNVVHIFALDRKNSLYHISLNKENPSWTLINECKEPMDELLVVVDNQMIVKSKSGSWWSRSLIFSSSDFDWTGEWDNLIENGNLDLQVPHKDLQILTVIHEINQIRWFIGFRKESLKKKFGYFGYNLRNHSWIPWEDVEAFEGEEVTTWPFGHQYPNGFEEYYVVDQELNILRAATRRKLKENAPVADINFNMAQSSVPRFKPPRLEFKKIGTGFIHNLSAFDQEKNGSRYLGPNFYCESLDFGELVKIKDSTKAFWEKMISPNVMIQGEVKGQELSYYAVQQNFDTLLQNDHFNGAVKDLSRARRDNERCLKESLQDCLIHPLRSAGDESRLEGSSKEFCIRLLSNEVKRRRDKRPKDAKLLDDVSAYTPELLMIANVALTVACPCSGPLASALISVAGDVLEAAVSKKWPLKVENLAKKAAVSAIGAGIDQAAMGLNNGIENINDIGNTSKFLRNSAVSFAAGVGTSVTDILINGKRVALDELLRDSAIRASLKNLNLDFDSSSSVNAAMRAGIDEMKFQLAKELITRGRLTQESVDKIQQDMVRAMLVNYAGHAAGSLLRATWSDDNNGSQEETHARDDDSLCQINEVDATEFEVNDSQQDISLDALCEDPQEAEELANIPNHDEEQDIKVDESISQENFEDPGLEIEPIQTENESLSLAEQEPNHGVSLELASVHEQNTDSYHGSEGELNQNEEVIPDQVLEDQDNRGFWERMSDARELVQNLAGDYCFTGETLVSTENGPMKIQDIQVGDNVWSCNMSRESADCKFRKVTKTYVRKVSEIWNLHTQDGHVQVTPNHPFYVSGIGYIPLDKIYSKFYLKGCNFKLRTLNGYGSEVIHMSKLREHFWVYNIEVEQAHSYFVSQVEEPQFHPGEYNHTENPKQWLLSHNCDMPADFNTPEDLELLKEGLVNGFRSTAQGIIDPAGLAKAAVEYTLDDSVAKDTSLMMIETIDGIYTVASGIVIAKFTLKAGKWTITKLAQQIPTDRFVYGVGEQGSKVIGQFKKTPAGKILIPKTRFNAVEGVGGSGNIGRPRNSNSVNWTPHGNKHLAPKGKSWSQVVDSTKNGPAKYTQDMNRPKIESLERQVWSEGTIVTNGKTWKVMETRDVIGASEGKPSSWIRVEESSGTIHGHPISQREYRKLTNEHSERY